MKISPISNTYNFYGKNLKNKKQSEPLSNNENSSKTEKGKNAVSFKSIYLENIVDLGMVSQQTAAPKFLKKDALLLNEIAQDYPNLEVIAADDCSADSTPAILKELQKSGLCLRVLHRIQPRLCPVKIKIRASCTG